MFREIRRRRQALSSEENIEILRRGTSGVLALSGDYGYPYAVPLSYVYHDHKLFFHSAKTGHKLDAIAKGDKVSFCVIDQDRVVPDEYTSYFRSVIVFGRARVLEEETEKRNALAILAQRYAPNQGEDHHRSAIEREFSIVCVVALSIEHISGKEAIELVQAKHL